MDSYPVPNPTQKRTNLIRAVVIEVGIISLIAIVLIFVLNYFKIIDFGFLSGNTKDKALETTNGSSGNPRENVPTVAPRTVVGQDLFNILKRNNAWIDSSNTSEFEARFVAVDNESGKDPQTGLEYRMKISIEVGGQKEKANLYYNSHVVSIMQVRNASGATMPLNELKSGDIIRVKTTYSLLQEQNKVKELIITKQ